MYIFCEIHIIKFLFLELFTGWCAYSAVKFWLREICTDMNEALLEPRYLLVEFTICVLPKYVLLTCLVFHNFITSFHVNLKLFHFLFTSFV